MAKIYHMLIYFHFSKSLNLELKVSKGIGPKQVLPEALIPDLSLYPLKTSENEKFSDVFRGYSKRSVAWNGLSITGNEFIIAQCLQYSYNFRKAIHRWNKLVYIQANAFVQLKKIY